MTLQTYVDMLKFQDRLHSFSYFRKAATGAISGSKAVDILQAYKETLEDDYPPNNEHCEHGEMLLYKVDKLSYKEQEVSLLEKLGHLSRYDEGLQRCMGLYSVNSQYSYDEIDRLESLYASLSKQYSRSSAVKMFVINKTWASKKCETSL